MAGAVMSMRAWVARLQRAALLLAALSAPVSLVGCGGAAQSAYRADEERADGDVSTSGAQAETTATAQEQEAVDKGGVADETARESSEIACDVVLVEQAEGCREYQLFYYDASSHALTAIADQTIFEKAAGYTEEILSEIDCDAIWPGVGELDYADVSCMDFGDAYVVTVLLSELDDMSNLQELGRYGLLVTQDEADAAVDARMLTDAALASGGTLMDTTTLGDDGRLLSLP